MYWLPEAEERGKIGSLKSLWARGDFKKLDVHDCFRKIQDIQPLGLEHPDSMMTCRSD